jgi:hypothetical protein
MKRNELSQQVLLVALVALMLAVPFSCLLAKAALWCLESRGARQGGRAATALPVQA